MPAQDPYLYAAATASGPAVRVFAASPSDSVDLPFVTTGLYIGTGGDIAVQDHLSGETVVFKNVGDGAGLPVRVSRVLATGTTATHIVGMA